MVKWSLIYLNWREGPEREKMAKDQIHVLYYNTIYWYSRYWAIFCFNLLNSLQRQISCFMMVKKINWSNFLKSVVISFPTIVLYLKSYQRQHHIIKIKSLIADFREILMLVLQVQSTSLNNIMPSGKACKINLLSNPFAAGKISLNMNLQDLGRNYHYLKGTEWMPWFSKTLPSKPALPIYEINKKHNHKNMTFYQIYISL